MFPTVATVPDLAGVETPVGLTHLTTAEPPWVDDRWGHPPCFTRVTDVWTPHVRFDLDGAR